MHTIYFEISGLRIAIKTLQLLTMTESYLPFYREEIKPSSIDVVAEFCPVTELPIARGRKYPVGLGIYVYQCGKMSERYYYETTGEKKCYAHREMQPDGILQVQYLAGEEALVNSYNKCFFYMGLEELFLQHGRMILHASCVKTCYGGVLFSGVSGIGKSTQAELWRRLEKGEIINGDRAVLYQTSGAWMASGSPYAGSSGCYVNEQIPIRAIVMLEQAEYCTIRRLSVTEAFKKVYAGMVINSWSADYVEKICDLCQQLVAGIPVYYLACTPDREAVETLKTVLLKNE